MLTLGVIHVMDLYDPEDKEYQREQTIAANIYNMDLDIIVLQDCSSLQLRYIQEKVGHLAYHSRVHTICQNVTYDVVSMCASKVTNIRQLQNICGTQASALIMNVEIPPDKSTPRSLEIEIVNLFITDSVGDDHRRLVIETVANSVEKQSIICGDFLGWTKSMDILRDWSRVFHFGHIATKNEKPYDPVAVYHTSGLIVNNAVLVDVANPYYTHKMSIRCCIAKRRPSSMLIENRKLRQKSSKDKSRFLSEPSVDRNESIISLNIKRRFSTCSDDTNFSRNRLNTSASFCPPLDMRSFNEGSVHSIEFSPRDIGRDMSPGVSRDNFRDIGRDSTGITRQISPIDIGRDSSEATGQITVDEDLPPVSEKKSSWFKFKFMERKNEKQKQKRVEKKVSIVDVGKLDELTLEDEPYVRKSSYMKKLRLPWSLLDNSEPPTPRGPKPIYLPVDCIHPHDHMKIEKLEKPIVVSKPQKKRKHKKRNMKMDKDQSSLD